jgi:hypothetical protein
VNLPSRPWWSTSSVPELDQRIVGLNPTDDHRFLRAIKIHSTTFFRGEAKESIPCCKILRQVKNLTCSKEILCRQNSAAISP